MEGCKLQQRSFGIGTNSVSCLSHAVKIARSIKERCWLLRLASLWRGLFVTVAAETCGQGCVTCMTLSSPCNIYLEMFDTTWRPVHLIHTSCAFQADSTQADSMTYLACMLVKFCTPPHRPHYPMPDLPPFPHMSLAGFETMTPSITDKAMLP